MSVSQICCEFCQVCGKTKKTQFEKVIYVKSGIFRVFFGYCIAEWKAVSMQNPTVDRNDLVMKRAKSMKVSIGNSLHFFREKKLF